MINKKDHLFLKLTYIKSCTITNLEIANNYQLNIYLTIYSNYNIIIIISI